MQGGDAHARAAEPGAADTGGGRRLSRDAAEMLTPQGRVSHRGAPEPGAAGAGAKTRHCTAVDGYRVQRGSAQVLQSLTQQALALGAEKLELQEMLTQQGRELDDALAARDAAAAAASAAAARAKALSRQVRRHAPNLTIFGWGGLPECQEQSLRCQSRAW